MNSKNSGTAISLNLQSITYDAALNRIVEDEYFAGQVNSATFVLPDGIPLVKALDLLDGKGHQLVAGIGAFPDLLKMAAGRSMNVYFFGSTEAEFSRIGERAKREFPNLSIVGSFSPTFDESLNNPDYIDAIINSGACLVFVALGCPKQEKWSLKHKESVNAKLVVCIGNVFDWYAGTQKKYSPFLVYNQDELVSKNIYTA